MSCVPLSIGALRKALLLAPLLLTLGACKPDEDITDRPALITPTPPPVDLCRPLPPAQNWTGEYYGRSIGQIHTWPLVEPVPNGRYLHMAVTPNSTDSVLSFPVYGAAGQHLNTLGMSRVIYRPSVSTRGWVAFSAYGRVWKRKLNGDSLRAITAALINGNSSYMREPHWLPDGRRLVVTQPYDYNNGLYYRMLLLDANGTVLRVVADWQNGDMFTPTNYAFSPDGQLMVTVGGLDGQPLYQLRAFNLQTKQLSVLASIVPEAGQEEYNGIHDATWAHTANVIFWTYAADIYRTDVATNQTRKIVDGCINSAYTYVSAAPDASYLLAARADKRWIGGDSVLYDNSVWRIAGDGSAMTRLPPL